MINEFDTAERHLSTFSLAEQIYYILELKV